MRVHGVVRGREGAAPSSEPLGPRGDARSTGSGSSTASPLPLRACLA
jgi:hypothetical protein